MRADSNVAPSPRGTPLRAGQELGPFTILREIGRGSWAIVYDAAHRVSGEVVALKWMFDADATAALKREFRIARGLVHPNLVRLHEMHHEQAGAFFTMERVLGGDIVSRCLRVQDAEARLKLVRRLFGDLAEALEYLHSAAVIHRDIKPANVLVDASDRVVVVDFGLAESVGAAGGKGFSGTFAYAAPERLHGHRATPGSDWYSFGVLLFEALSGALPYSRNTNAAMMARLEGKRVDVAGKLPVAALELAPLLEHLLEPAPAQRADAHAVFGALAPPPLSSTTRSRARVRARRGPFVGRADARAFVLERLRPGGTLAITGPSGIGKTALVRSVLEGLGTDCVALRSQCHPRENVPFNAFDGAVAALLERARRAASPENSADVELIERVFERPAHGPSALRDDVASSSVVASALARLLGAVTRAPPERDGQGGPAAAPLLVLVIDDVQWADRDSCALFEHLLGAPGWRATWVVIARGGHADIPAPIRSRIRDTDTLELGPLDAESSVSLLRSVAPELSEERAIALAGLAGCQPLSLVELARWTEAVAPPGTVAELMLSAAEARTVGQRDLLARLAVHDGPIDSEVLVAVESTALARAYDLLDVGLVEFERTSTRYVVRIRHAEMADAVRATLDIDALAAAHLDLARAYERARPDQADARFRHLARAGRPEAAAVIGLEAARQLRDRVALHLAIERYKWLLANGGGAVDELVVLRELAETQGRAGEAMDAGETYLALAARSPRRARELRRAAAEQLLRAGESRRGRALLERCLEEVGLRAPTSRVAQAAWIVAGRARIRARSLSQPLDRRPDAVTRARLEVAWSAGLGLNLVDVVSSMLAQVQFTDLALGAGSAEQIARAVGVEYSYAMMTGGPLSAGRARDLELAMERLEGHVPEPYARGMMELSRGAGDFFRGRIHDVPARLARSRSLFQASLGQKSWELANCAMYEAWALIEQGELERVSREVPECVRLASARGDALYKQCFVGGPCSVAWLVEGRVDDLVAALDAIPRSGEMSQSAFFEIVARTRADFYRNEPRAAWRRLASMWPRIERSGFLSLRWMRLTLAVLFVQAAIGARDADALRAAEHWVRKIERIDHPAARAWSIVLGASLRAAQSSTGGLDRRTELALGDAERRFESAGFSLSARATGHVRAKLAGSPSAPWPACVASPDAFARAVFGPAPGLG